MREETVDVHDPYMAYWQELKINVFELPETKGYDAIVFCVPHNQYKALPLKKWLIGSEAILLDTANIFSKEQRSELRSAGIRVESIGRGNGL